MPIKKPENNLTDLTRLSGPAATVLSFDDLKLATYCAVVGPAWITEFLRQRLLSSDEDRNIALQILNSPWFPAGIAERHEMAFRSLKNRLWWMSENRFDETLQVLTLIKDWKRPKASLKNITNEHLSLVRNLGTFYELFYPGLCARL